MATTTPVQAAGDGAGPVSIDVGGTGTRPVTVTLQGGSGRGSAFSLKPQNTMEELLVWNAVPCLAMISTLVLVLSLSALVHTTTKFPPGLVWIFNVLYWFPSNILFYFLIMSVFFRREVEVNPHTYSHRLGPWVGREVATLIIAFYIGGLALSFFPTWLALYSHDSKKAITVALTVMLVLQGFTKFSMALVAKIDPRGSWPCSWQGLFASGFVSMILSAVVLEQGKDKLDGPYLMVYIADLILSGACIKVADWFISFVKHRISQVKEPLLQ